MSKKSKTPAPITPQQSVSEAFQTILRHNFDYLTEWEGAARNWDDTEGVHQTRVAFRRMRSAFSAFRSAVPRAVSRDWSEELRHLASQLGMARDLDVFIDEGLGAIEGKLTLRGRDRLLQIAQEHRRTAYDDVNAMLDGARYAGFKRDFPAWLDEKGWEQGELKGKHRETLESNVLPFARGLLDGLERKVLEAGHHADRESAKDMHSLRIECKKLRYAAEFFSPVIDGLDEFIGHMKRLQDLLGIMNDVSVMQHLLDTMLADVTDHEVLEYAGGLVGWRTCEFYNLADTFDDRWEEFTNARHPWWTKQAGGT